MNADTKIMEAMLDHRRYEDAATYAAHGRCLAAPSSRYLQRQWIAEFRSWATAAEQDVRYDHQVMNDCESELLLRGKDPPHNDVRPEFEIIRAASARIIR